MKKGINLTPSRFLVLGFMSIILIGAIILRIPISIKDGVDVTFWDTLFTSTSAVCVTGLVVKDTFDTFTYFGRFIIMVLIQIGGLGFSTVAVLILIGMGRKLNISAKFYAKEGLNINSMANINGVIKSVIKYTMTVEVIGAIFSTIAYSRYYNFPRAITIGIFHSISAFNNAGFDCIGSFASLTGYNTDIFLNSITMFLIVIGGLGYYVISDLRRKKSFKKLGIHSKICFLMAAILIVGGTILIYFTENTSVLEALFQSVTTRTAGFATVDLASFTHVGIILMTLLMFIGASPSSTGGGVKTTTIFVAFRTLYCHLRNKQVTAFKRGININTQIRAFSLILVGFTLIITGSLLITWHDGLSFIQVLFECTSAFATVGLTTGITPSLSLFARAIIIILMFIGRLGPITIGYLWSKDIPSKIKYIDEDVLIG